MLLTHEEHEMYLNKTSHCMCKNELESNSRTKEIVVILHNRSNCDHKFIIKELEKEFKGRFEWLGENVYNFFCTNEIKNLIKMKNKLKKLIKIENKLLRP